MYKNYDENRQEKVYEIVLMIKLFSLLFAGIIIFSEYMKRISGRADSITVFLDMIPISVIIAFMTLLCCYWIYAAKKYGRDNIWIIITEILFFISVYTCMVLLDSSVTQYKMLYMFIIITSTMQFGMFYGFVTALVSSALVLIIDLYSMPGAIINENFQSDLILVGIFNLTAWLLGYYEKIEREHREQMLLLASVDGLTDVYNHRYFHDTLKKAVEDARKTKTPVSLLLLDIDYFKHYNDLFGHQAGDEVLRKIGRILKVAVRVNDVVARYGGEEFGIILPNTTEEQACAIAERIRAQVEMADFAGEENQPNGKITVSVGVSCFPDKAKNYEELINSTDDPLYRAKFFNKNRVETYFSVLEELKNDMDEEHIDILTSIKTLISIINAKDRYTYGHTERVVVFCGLLADKLGLSEQEKKILKYGAYLHDIGKIHISKEVLNKKMKLTDEEWDILKQHPVNGVEIIKPVESLAPVVPLILHHHERYGGGGYPDGLRGTEIPYLARVLTVADSFDAMTSNRPYKARRNYDDAILELRRCSYTQFDPVIAEAFISVIQENKDNFNDILDR